MSVDAKTSKKILWLVRVPAAIVGTCVLTFVLFVGMTTILGISTFTDMINAKESQRELVALFESLELSQTQSEVRDILWSPKLRLGTVTWPNSYIEIRNSF